MSAALSQRLDRRQVLKRAAGVAIGSMLAAPSVAQARTKLRLGYLHVVAVDGHIWTGLDRGSFDKQGLDFELHEFNTGPEVFEAMADGRLDVLSAGGVISNYLALGRGRAFVMNDIEVATAQLWVRPALGVSTFADLKGKRIATTTRTTAHIFLDRALRANNVDPSQVEIVDRNMSGAVRAFMSGEVPAVALWVPFNITVREEIPDAIKLVDASAFYPQSAVLGGWVARPDYYADNKEVLVRIIRAWAEANDYMVRNPGPAAQTLHDNHYSQAKLSDVSEAFKAEKMFTSREWKRLYTDGTVVKWLQQVSDFFIAEGRIPNPVPAADYFDPSLYLAEIK
ncbi:MULTISPECIES: ABC transporter substrate-binding protein [Bradyrhizobium]|uniref:ABC-type nitrate/sulfonate/bicarbonate transport system, periplasmic component n=1 Tax=Bradyrhizobium vignae TaxID=1549949 RepID=A0A2U3Q5V2_9BRAD|nr:ABC transporter substrate-binding protein [Bradyrhizobium vignae]RXG86616.1 ABC transporter substrate-binding protein [Bradyrhizobium vignae]SPP96794.1 ABC-type nitrate/sulfonate/bicarbonate transport system, periplasmic component [Bradyrhizobium vignae]